MSGANSAMPTPHGTPHINARRLDFENASYKRSGLSLARAIAGYRACVTMVATRVAYDEVVPASVIAPTAAVPMWRCTNRIGTCAIRTPDAFWIRIGHEKVAYSRSVPFS